MTKKRLTTREVARVLCVSEATVKRWTESRMLNSERTVGGHRRFRVEEVARFQREQGLGANIKRKLEPVVMPQARLNESRSQQDSSATLFVALVEGREEEAAALLCKSYLNGASLSSIFDRVLSKAMRRVGELWYQGELSVAREHLATRTAHNALQVLRGLIALPESRDLHAISCSTEGDFHELPVHLSDSLLRSMGWEVVNLGSNTPFYALTDALLRHAPDLICVSSAILYNLDRAVSDYREFHAACVRAGVSVVLGGKGFEDRRLRSRFPADFYAQSFAQLEEFAQALGARLSATG